MTGPMAMAVSALTGGTMTGGTGQATTGMAGTSRGGAAEAEAGAPAAAKLGAVMPVMYSRSVLGVLQQQMCGLGTGMPVAS